MTDAVFVLVAAVIAIVLATIAVVSHRDRAKAEANRDRSWTLEEVDGPAWHKTESPFVSERDPGDEQP